MMLFKGLPGWGDDRSSADETDKKQYSIVINAKNAPSNGNSNDLIRQLYLKLRSEWPAGQKAKPFSRPPDSAEQIALLKHILDMTETELANYWLSLKQRTGQTPPRSVSSTRILFKLISKYEGAFSIVDTDLITTLPDDVIILATISD